jgi:hypothetical protein
MVNSNWPRWIKLSVVQAFRTAIGNDLSIFVEGTVERVSNQNFCELRFDGPFYDEVSKGYWNIDITIDVLVCTYLDPKDAVVHERNVGSVLAGFNTNIPVMQYGTGPDDNPSIQLGCLRVTGKVVTTPFGQVKPDTRLMQSTVEQTFRMNLKA